MSKISCNFQLAASPCWNLASKRVGSYDLNDPLVKVTFYRVSFYYSTKKKKKKMHENNNYLF